MMADLQVITTMGTGLKESVLLNPNIRPTV